MYIINMFCHAQICTDDYFLPSPFLQRGVIFACPCSLTRTTDEVEKPWGLSSRGELLGLLHSTFSVLQSMRRSPTYG